MIEQTLYNYLVDALDEVAPVYMMRPETPPATYVMLMKTGGSKTEHLYTDTFALQSIAPTLYEAVSLDDQVREVMDAAADNLEGQVTRARLTNCYDFTNPTTKQPRYQSVYEIIHY